MDIRTKAVLEGTAKDSQYNSVITPIYPTSTFRFEELGKHKGYDYTRSGNPTRAALEENIAALEEGLGASATATGMAAITTVLFLLKPGDHIVTGNDIYGGTYRLYELNMKDYGIDFSWVDTSKLKNIEAAIKPNTKMVFVETPTNPMLNLTDLEGTAKICKKNNLISIVDNTFMSPYFQNPLTFGCDIVLHSQTKYINGHSDVIGGILVTSDDKIHTRLRYIQNAAGGIP